MAAELAHLRHAAHHVPGDLRRIIDDDSEAARSILSERGTYETQDVIEIDRAFLGAREYDGKGLLAVRRLEQQADQVQNLFRSAGAARKNNYAMRETHERL